MTAVATAAPTIARMTTHTRGMARTVIAAALVGALSGGVSMTTRLIAVGLVALVAAPVAAQEPSGPDAPPPHHASVADSAGTAASTPQLSMETRQQVQLMLTELELAETRIRLYERERQMILQQVQRV